MNNYNSTKNRNTLIEDTILSFYNKVTPQGLIVDIQTSGLASETTLSSINTYAQSIYGELLQPNLLYFIQNGVEQLVTEDTTTPSNNAPLPVKLTSVSGDINITAGDLNVQTDHRGTNYDSIRIGDGTHLLAIESDGSINVNAIYDVPIINTIAHTTNRQLTPLGVRQIDSTGNICKKVTITANENNSDWIRIGNLMVTQSTGIILYPGESYDIEINNTNKLYGISKIVNDSVSLTYYN